MHAAGLGDRGGCLREVVPTCADPKPAFGGRILILFYFKLPILVGWRSAVTQRSHVLVGKGSVDAPCFPFDAQDYLILVG